MKKLVVLLMVSLMATSAFAVVDPDPNMIGVYFDMNADSISTPATMNVPFFAYVMLTNPTYAEISGFEAAYSVQVPLGFESLFFRLNEDLQGGLNVAVGNTATAGEYIVGWPAPRPTSPATVLVSWQLMLLSTFSADIFLGPTTAPSGDNPNLPALEVGGSIVNLGTSTGDPAIPVAVINPAGPGDVPVAEEGASFGDVKALFR